MLGVERAFVKLGEEPDAGKGGIVGWVGSGRRHGRFVYLQTCETQEICETYTEYERA
jgi:hypothetical protein